MDKTQQMQSLLAQIPKGKVTTYKLLAKKMGTKGYRFVGQLLGKNPDPETFPCYKVVRSDGGISGYALGVPEKVRRLKADGIEIKNDRVVNLKEKLYQF